MYKRQTLAPKLNGKEVIDMNELARKPKRWPKIVSRTFLILVTILLVFPFFWMVLLSFKSDTQILNNPFSLVLDAGFSNYVRAMPVSDTHLDVYKRQPEM